MGGLDPILGETENDIRKIMRDASADRANLIEDMGRRLEDQVFQAQKAGQMLGDFIMDTKSYRREIAERITGRPPPIDNNDFERFLGNLLAGVGAYIEEDGDVYQLTFHGDFYDSNRLRFFPGGNKMKAVFRPDHRPDAQDVEFMAFGHRIIDEVVTHVLDEQYKGVTGTRRIHADQELTPTAGWLFTYQFTIPGVKSVERLIPVFVSDDGEVNEETGRLLVERACRFDREEEIDPIDIPKNIEEMATLANQFVSERREMIQRQAAQEAVERTEREVSRLLARFDYRERAAQNRLEATRATLRRIRASNDETQRRILPVWEANFRRDEGLPGKLVEERKQQIAVVERHRFPQVDWGLKSLGRIEVFPQSDFPPESEF